MKKQQKHYDKTELPESEKVGDEKWFFRIIRFENGIVVDGEANDELIFVLTGMMLERKEIKQLLKTVVKLHNRIKDTPLAALAIRAMLMDKDRHVGGECNCPSCCMRRNLEKMTKEN